MIDRTFFYNRTTEQEELLNKLFCWKCKTKLVKRRMNGVGVHSYTGWGLYCERCRRFREFNVEAPVERRGVGFCRTDVRRSGALKRKVELK
jgi:predicted nucleic acid-binding Zn ribbon protein